MRCPWPERFVSIRPEFVPPVIGSRIGPLTSAAGTRTDHKEDTMGLMDDAKDAAEATGKKVGEWVDDTRERISDKVDEVRADARVADAQADLKKAEAERDATEAKNEYKERLRD
jgi:hypothetical protein